MKSSYLATFTILSLFTACHLQAQKEVTNADLLRKLEEIQGQVESLEKRVTSLEGKATTSAIALPNGKEDRESYLQRLRHDEGDLNADGKKERGTVNFFNGRVVSVEKP